MNNERRKSLKQIILLLFGLLLLISCGQKKRADVALTDSASNDSALYLSDDSVDLVETPNSELAEVDRSFDDFLYSFATNDSMQRSRVKFPLPYYDGKNRYKIEARFWGHDHLFSQQTYYTQLYDSEKDMEIEKDTSIFAIKVEWIFMKERTAKIYAFQREKSKWMLESISLLRLKKASGEDFIEFFQKFSNDSVFQMQRLHQPLAFVTIDPDDEFHILNTTLEPGQWLAFKPELPLNRLSNIDYGQPDNLNSSIKILALKGVGNGLCNVLYFRKYGGKWKLYKFEDTSV